MRSTPEWRARNFELQSPYTPRRIEAPHAYAADTAQKRKAGKVPGTLPLAAMLLAQDA